MHAHMYIWIVTCRFCTKSDNLCTKYQTMTWDSMKPLTIRNIIHIVKALH